MARPIVLGVAGDSGSGKTTLTRGLMRVMGDEAVKRISADDYHRYERRERKALGITPLHPDANHLDVLTQHLLHIRRGEAILKPRYDHRDGTLGRPEYLRPAKFLVIEGLLNFHTETLRAAHDIRVFLAPPEDLRRAWKLKRDCTRRSYTTDEVLHELDVRERDAARYVRPQRAHADIVVAFGSSATADPARLDAEVLLRDTLPHPDLSPLLASDGRGPTISERERDVLLRIPGSIDPVHAAELEEALWTRMSFANHLRVRRLGEFTVGTDLLRSDSLALVQLLILYHLVWARATAIGGPDRAQAPAVTGADSALHV
ncbi:MAG: phosphoribulokinase [Actinomycetota bacterium]|nr:phosphoribulokinase [Actinomycetota bacterium]